MEAKQYIFFVLGAQMQQHLQSFYVYPLQHEQHIDYVSLYQLITSLQNLAVEVHLVYSLVIRLLQEHIWELF